MMSGSAMKDGAKSGPSGLLFAVFCVVWRVLIAELSWGRDGADCLFDVFFAVAFYIRCHGLFFCFLHISLI